MGPLEGSTQTHGSEISLASLDADVIERLRGELRERHHLDGAYADSTRPVLMFRLPPEALKILDRGDKPDIKILPVLHEGEFGSHLLIRARFRPTGEASYVALPATSPVSSRLIHDEFYAVFARGLKPVFASQWNLRSSGDFLDVWHEVLQHRPTVSDESASYFELLLSVTDYRKTLTAKDRLSLGWVESYRARIRDLQSSLNRLQVSNPLPLPFCANESLAECVTAFLETVRNGGYRLATLFPWMQRQIGNDGAKLCSLFGLGHKLFQLDALKHYGPVIREACETYAWSSAFSDCGQRIPWIDTEANAICTLELSPRDFPKGFPETDFWRRQIWDLPYELGKTIAAKDVPIDPCRFVEQEAGFPRAENVEEAQRHTLQLLEDAVCNKKWTIPWGAIVQLQIGPFTHVEVFEIAENVFFVFRTADGETSTAAVSPPQRWCVVAFPRGLTEQDKVIEAAVSLLLSAVVRDFWVIEEREATFSPASEGRGDVRLWPVQRIPSFGRPGR